MRVVAMLAWPSHSCTLAMSAWWSSALVAAVARSAWAPITGIGSGLTGAILATSGVSGRPCAQDGGGAPGACAASPGTGAGDELTAGALVCCCAPTGPTTAANPLARAASNTVREHDRSVFMTILLLGGAFPAAPCAHSGGRRPSEYRRPDNCNPSANFPKGFCRQHWL